ncbi:MAG: type II secretion system protein GspK [Bdellovibrionota bacterium]
MKKKDNKTRLIKLPKTYWGFPIESDDDKGTSLTSLPSQNDKHKQGIALLIAIMVVAIVMGFIADLIISSSVNVELAMGQRDRIKSEFIAKSGINLGEFLTSIDWGIDLYMAQNKQKPTDGIGDIWAMLNGLPIGGSTLELLAGMQEKFKLNAVNDSSVLDQIKLLDGQFVLNISDESSKINVNYCYKGRCTQVIHMLEALMSCPAERAFLDKKGIKIKELIYRIKDFIDDNNKAEGESGYSDENDPYLDKKPKYQVKNAPFDSLEELKLVEGWDDEVHAVFSPYLTVYPFQTSGRDVATININTASRSMLACLIPDDLKDECREKFVIRMFNQSEEKANFSDDGDMKKVLKDLVCYNGDGSNTSSSNDKSAWFAASSKVFRLEAKGEVGNQRRKLIVVIERLDPKEMKRQKTTKSFNLLYWKLI